MAGGYVAGISRVSMTVLVCVLVFGNKGQQQKLPERSISVSACYTNRINAICNSAEVIAVDEVNAGAKLISTSCMSASSEVNTSNPECCERDSFNDCFTLFVNEHTNLTYRYHDQCTGQEVCGPIEVQWMRVMPDWCTQSTLYRDYTGYLDINYFCIKNTSVGILPDISLTSSSNSALYIQGQYYPAYMENSTSVSCSIESTCGSGISIKAIHINFDNVGGVCQQTMTISDPSGDTTVITCDDNNNYNITEIYRSSSNYATLEISSQQGEGQLWVGFIPPSGGSLKLSCPAVPRSVNPDTPCDDSDVTEPNKHEADTDGGGKTNDNAMTIIIAVVVSLVLLIIIIIVALLLRWKYKKQKNAKVAPEKASNTKQDADTNSDHDLDILNSIPFEASTAPWATKVTGPRGSDLPPIKAQTNDISEQDDDRKKKKKKRKKKKKKSSENDETVLTQADEGCE